MRRTARGRRRLRNILLLFGMVAFAHHRANAADTIGRTPVWIGGGVTAARTLTSGSGHANLSILQLEGGWRLSKQTEFGLEVSPISNVRQPDSFRGDHIENVRAFSAALLVRRHFDLPLGPFVEGSAGMIRSSRDIPAETTNRNFILATGAGIVLVERGDWSMIGSYRLIHISNGDREDSNPGYNMQSLRLSVRFDFER